MSDKNIGLIKKYEVTKISNPSKEIDAIVLEFDDDLSIPAIRMFAYTMGVSGYKRLQDDILSKLKHFGKSTLMISEVYQMLHGKIFQQEAEITKLKKALEVANKAIEFYADKSKWGYSGVPKNRSHLAGIIVDNDCGMDLEKNKFMGGKRAREAQKQIKEIMEAK